MFGNIVSSTWQKGRLVRNWLNMTRKEPPDRVLKNDSYEFVKRTLSYFKGVFIFQD